MAYTAKDYARLIGMAGFSEALLVPYYGLKEAGVEVAVGKKRAEGAGCRSHRGKSEPEILVY